jgi:Uncharacterized protein conserved in bacteria
MAAHPLPGSLVPLEIERKFLVAGEAWRAQVVDAQEMRQGYLVGTGGRASVRVRIAGDAARLNIKAAVIGAARAEYDYPVPLDEAREILDRLCLGRVEKRRHKVPAGGGRTWEIDEFFGDNAGLVVAEIEIGSEDEAFAHPDWLGREVTDDARYYNHALALKPYSQWSDADRD